jgi:hypothetical protein
MVTAAANICVPTIPASSMMMTSPGAGMTFCSESVWWPRTKESIVVALAPSSVPITDAATAVGARPMTRPPASLTVSAASLSAVVLPAPAGPTPTMSSRSLQANSLAMASWPASKVLSCRARAASKDSAVAAGMTMRCAADRSRSSLCRIPEEVYRVECALPYLDAPFFSRSAAIRGRVFPG